MRNLQKMRVKDDFIIFYNHKEQARIIASQHNKIVDYVEWLERRIAALEKKVSNNA